MKYKAILFDADGVVIISKPQFSELLEANYGITKEKINPFFTGPFRECSVGKADLKEELAKVLDDWGWKGTVEELMHYWFTEGTQIDGEVVEFIKSLRRDGVHCYMVTDQEKYRGEHLRDKLTSDELFNRVFFSAEIGYTKKKIEYFEHVYGAISPAVSKEEILFVDDGEKNIDTAKEFGFDVHFYASLDKLKQKLNTFT